MRTLLAVIVVLPLAGLILFGAAVLLTPLPEPRLPEATTLVDAAGEPIARLFQEDRTEIPAVQMPQHLRDAVVAVEDERFYQHYGIDLIGIARAAVRNLLSSGSVEGGSTLTQQLARTLYLSQERTLTRKLREAVYAVKLEHEYSKDEILAMYLNSIYLGRGAYGVEVASQTYFGKPARELTLGEAALLAGLPRSPEYYSPFNNLEAAVSRRNLVLDKMVAHQFITAEEAAAAKEEQPKLAEEKRPSGQAQHFVDYVIRELRERFPEVAEDLYHGGYRIRTSLDLRMQRLAATALQEAPAEAALVAIDPTSGHIKALVGGKSLERNRALEGQQPGSAFKPFVYAAALETRNYAITSTQVDEPVEFPGAVAGEFWRPKNYGDRYTYRPTTMREALLRSVNTVTARWMYLLKPDPVINLARRMGIQSPLPSDLTIGLGSADVTPLELTRAYVPFANGGFAVEPIAVLSVTDSRGMVVAEQSTVRTRAIDAGVAFLITDLLKDVLRAPEGTASWVAPQLAGRPAAGKTGTSDDGRDAWFVGYTPDLVAGVWVGEDNNAASSRTGSSAAAPIWAQFVSRALTGKPYRDWTAPQNVVTQKFCSETGLRPNTSCPVGQEYFLLGTAPVEVDPTVHWEQVLPSLPGMPWAPPGSLPPT